MKRWMIYIGGIVILGLLVVRMIARKSSRIGDEKIWYVENLNYSFSAEIDTIMLLNEQGVGYLICSLTSGTISYSYEDSLNRHLKYHDHLRFIPRRRDGKLQFLNGAANKYLPKDSIVVNSDDDRWMIFRNGEKMWEKSVLKSLRGDPAPFGKNHNH